MTLTPDLLHDYQKKAVNHQCTRPNSMLWLDMGLGKTTSTIIAALETGAKKILIVCPASLKINWEREIKNYTDRSTFICESRNFSLDHDFVIVNYDILKNFYDLKTPEESDLSKAGFELIIVDEAHYVQNTQAQRTKIINQFSNWPFKGSKN